FFFLSLTKTRKKINKLPFEFHCEFVFAFCCFSDQDFSIQVVSVYSCFGIMSTIITHCSLFFCTTHTVFCTRNINSISSHHFKQVKWMCNRASELVEGNQTF